MGFITEWDAPIPTEEPEDIPETDSSNWSISFLINNKEAWESYNDELSYQFEKDVRSWITYMRDTDRNWTRSAKRRKYRLSMLVKAIWNIDYKPSEHRKYQQRWIDIFRYYSSRITRTYYDPVSKKTRDKTCYVISPARLSKPPLNIKLRIEWFEEQGIQPYYRNTQVIADTLAPGHARDPKVEANMRKRSERSKERWAAHVARERRAKYAENRRLKELDASGSDGSVPDDLLPGEDNR